MIRIAIISEPGFAGVKRHVVDLLHHLDTTEFQILFLYSLVRADGQYAAEIEVARARGIQCVDIGFVREIDPRRDLVCAWAVWRELRRFRPHICHVHSSKAGFIGRFCAKFASLGVRTVYTPNALACYDSRLYWYLEKAAGWVTDRIVGVSLSETQDIRRWGLVKPECVVCIPLCVRDPGEYPSRHPNSQLVNAKGAVVVACGRICRQKQALLFFQAAACVMRQHPEVEFRWIGSYGDDAEAVVVKQFIESDPNARRVKITGWIPDADQEIANADVFCMCSRYESFGYVTADAMMMEVPVVAVPTTGTVDLVESEVTGLLCNSAPDCLASAIIRLVNDRRLGERLAQAARARVSSAFSRTKMISDISCLYRQLSESARN